MKNGYTSATGTQEIISTPAEQATRGCRRQAAKPRPHQPRDRADARRHRRASGCASSTATASTRCARRWRRRSRTDFAGLKVIIAEGECQLERQRRIKPWLAGLVRAGKRTVRVKYGVDEDTCSGDHSCIRLSGCPTLSVKASSDPLRVDPVATVLDGCVGCGLCGENAHAATLCPSFYRARGDPQPALARAPRRATAARGDRRGSGSMNTNVQPDFDPDRGARRRGRRRARPNGLSLRLRARALPRRARRFRASRNARARPPTTSRSIRCRWSTLDGRVPVLGLLPVPGRIDLVVASELLEAVRVVHTGMTTPERTLLVTSTSRTLTTAEKMPLGDGRFDSALLQDVARRWNRGRRRLRHGGARARIRHRRERDHVRRHCRVGHPAVSRATPAPPSSKGRIAPRAASRAGFVRACAAMEARGSSDTTRPATVDDGSCSARRGERGFSAVDARHRCARAASASWSSRIGRTPSLYLDRLQRVLAAERVADPSGERGFRADARDGALSRAVDGVRRCRPRRRSQMPARAASRASGAKSAPADRDVVRIFDYMKPGLPEFSALAAARLRRAPGDVGSPAPGTRPAPIRARAHAPHRRRDGVSRIAHAVVAAVAAAARRALRRGAGRHRALAFRARRGGGARLASRLRNRAVGTARQGLRRDQRARQGESPAYPGPTSRMGRPARPSARARSAMPAKPRLPTKAATALDKTLAAHGAPPRPVKAQPIRWMGARSQVRTKATETVS